MKPSVDMLSSPYERDAAQPLPAPTLVQLRYTPRPRWTPSRFNARTVLDDGRLMLWNTLSGSINIFEAEKRDAVVARLSARGVEGPLDQTAEYLSSRGYLVPAGTNEMGRFRYLHAQAQWRPDTLNLHLLASEDCNFRCVYCYEKFERGTMAPEVRQGVRALVEQRAPRLNDLSISWFGGEPLYGWAAVEDLCPFFKEMSDRHGFTLFQSMTTNAYLLTPEKQDLLLRWGVRQYQITIDGVAEDHDCKRVGRDGSPTHAVILQNLRALRDQDENYLVHIRVNFDQGNVMRLGRFLEELSEDFGGDTRFKLRFRAVGKWGGPNDDSLDTCGMSEQRGVKRMLRDTAEALNLRQEGGILELARPGSQVCYAARPYSFIIGADGTLMKCTVALYDLPENVVGKIHPDGRLELDDDHMAAWVNAHFETDEACQKCYVLPTCQGSLCPLTRIRHGVRTCCGVKSELKHEMRFTLGQGRWERAHTEAVRERQLRRAPAAVAAAV